MKYVHAAAIFLLGVGMIVWANSDTNIPSVSTVTEIPDVKSEVKDHSVKNLSPSMSNVLTLYGQVGGAPTLELAEKIKRLSQKHEIYLLIDSPGGSVIDGAMVVSAMESAKYPVNTVCMRICASMGAIIHQYGTKRLMVNKATLMFHDAAGGLQGYVPHMRSRLNWIVRMTEKMDAYIAKRSKHDLTKFMLDISHEIWLDGEEALDQNYADGLVNVILEAGAMSFLGGDSKEKIQVPTEPSFIEVY